MRFRLVALLMFGAVAPALAQAPTLLESVASLEITGTADATVDYDEARVTLTVDVQAPQQDRVVADLKRRIDTVMTALKPLALADADLRSTGPQLDIVYETPRDTGVRRPVGVHGRYELTVTVHDLNGVGPLLDRATDAGALVDGVAYSVSDARSRQQALTEAAIRDAVTRAHAYAAAAGVKTGRILRISEGSQPRPMMRMVAAPAPMMKASFTPAVRPGRETINATATVTIELVNP